MPRLIASLSIVEAITFISFLVCNHGFQRLDNQKLLFPSPSIELLIKKDSSLTESEFCNAIFFGKKLPRLFNSALINNLE